MSNPIMPFTLARHTPLLITVLLLLLTPTSAQTCYNQNDSIDPPSVPCYPANSTGTSQSFCCPVGRQCYTNGLCGPSNTDPNYGRLSCTDPTWRSPECPQFCLSNDGAGGAVVVLCPGTDQQYCCSNLARDGTTYGCCDNTSNFLALGKLVEVDNGTIVSSTSSSVSKSTSAAARATSAAVAASSSASPNSGSSGVAIGVGVGVGLAAVLAIGLGLFFFIRRRKTRPPLHGYPSSQQGGSYRAEAPLGYAHEMKHELGNMEVIGARRPGDTVELDGRSERRGEPAELG